MAHYKSLPVFPLILLGLLAQEARASDPTLLQKGSIGQTQAKPEEAGTGKGTKERKSLPSDSKAVENKPVWTPEDRKAGTVTIKPLMVNFSALTPGMRKKNQILNGYSMNAYGTAFGYMTNRTDRAGNGYDLELGIMATNAIEIFTILGISHESPFKKVPVMYPPFTPPFTLTNAAFDFKPRDSFDLSLGGRHYWNTEKPWFPFVGIMGTVTFQGPVKADVFRIIDSFLKIYAPVGPLTLQGRKTLWGGTLLAGADYQFNRYTSLTLSVGLRYTPRVSTTYTSINGISISFRDDTKIWSLPVLAALKFTF